MTFSAITLSAAARLSVQTPPMPPLRSVVVTSNLALSPSAVFDLSANDLIVRAANLSTISSDIHSGIISSSDSTNLTTLGGIQNSVDGTTTGVRYTPILHQWHQHFPNTDVLVKFTYFGDTNLDGNVNGSDYIQIDNGFAQNLPGWFNGDLNGDGAVNGDDYTLIDNAFNTQASVTISSVHRRPDRRPQITRAVRPRLPRQFRSSESTPLHLQQRRIGSQYRRNCLLSTKDRAGYIRGTLIKASARRTPSAAAPAAASAGRQNPAAGNPFAIALCAV